MLTEQALDYGARVAAPAARPAAIPAGDSLLQAHEQPRARPRATLDTLLAACAAAFALAFVEPEIFPTDVRSALSLQLSVQDLILAAAFFLIWPRILTLSGVYEARDTGLRSEVFTLFVASSIGSMVGMALLSLSTNEIYGTEAILTFWILLMTVLLTFRGFAMAVNTQVRSRVQRRVLIVGSGVRARRLAHELEAAPERYELIGFVDDEPDGADAHTRSLLLGKLNDLEGILAREVVDEVLIALPIKSCYSAIERAIEVSERVGVESKYLADVFRCQLSKVRYEQRREIPFIAMKVFYDDHRVRFKRAIDFLGALVGLMVLSPLMIGIAIAVKMTSPGPIIFAQERYGLNKRRFKMYKFRTMVPDAERLQAELEDLNEAAGPLFKIKNDPRVTPIGRFLRKSSLDELPQLFNVLMGDMSLVGPRPLPVRDVQLFDEPWFMRRFSVRPGLTCLWQISGRSNLGFDDQIALDLKYIDDWSLGADIEILARTIPAVVRGVGAA